MEKYLYVYPEYFKETKTVDDKNLCSLLILHIKWKIKQNR